MSIYKLPPKFYLQPTLKVAKDLLGKFLVHQIGKKRLVGRIIETEAYCGPNDLASHASRGKTKRTALMFGAGGLAYIYLIYGMYYCFNVVTGRENYPAAVLIRGVEPICPTIAENSNSPLHVRMRTNGPGKLCRYLKIDKRLNGVDLTGNTLWIEDRGEKVRKKEIAAAKRIGVDYSGRYKHKKWRFYIHPHT